MPGLYALRLELHENIFFPYGVISNKVQKCSKMVALRLPQQNGWWLEEYETLLSLSYPNLSPRKTPKKLKTHQSLWKRAYSINKKRLEFRLKEEKNFVHAKDEKLFV